MTASRPEAAGLLLSDDLMFTSRITGVAQQLGMRVTPVRFADRLLAGAREASPACVIVDLANPGLRIGELVDGLRQACPSVPYLVAYGSHVDAAGLKAARDAGCDLVLPRSKFVEVLPAALPEWFGRRAGASTPPPG